MSRMKIAVILGISTLAPLALVFITYLFYKYARFARRVPAFTSPKTEEVRSPDKNTFKILSLNVKMIDWYTAMPSQTLSMIVPHKRRKKIIDFLKTCDHDVVVLQEAFNSGFQEIIKRDLQKIFPYQMTYRPKTHLFRWINNGLMTLSRYPLTDARFLEFKDLRGADGWVPKGATIATVLAPKPFKIFNTHMQAFEGEESDRLRIHGVQEIDRFLQIESDDEIPIILGGDFNVSRRNDYLRAMLRLLRVNLYEVDGEVKFTWDPLTNPLCNPKRGKEPETLDWLFVRDGGKKIKHTFARIVPVSISDHYPVEREFEIK